MEATFSLYIDLESGRVADLDVVARAALAFSAAVREAAKTIDPFLDIRVEIESGTEGSLKLNTIFRAIKKLSPNKITLTALVGIGISWFATDLRQYGMDKLFDHLFKSDPSINHNISENERKEIIEIVNDIIAKKVASEFVEQVYRELDQDDVIKGVGASKSKGEKPSSIVPKSEFRARGYNQVIVEESSESRTTTAVQTLILVSPVLAHNNRGWRFFFSGQEFTAKIADKKFLDEALAGKANVPFREGVHLLVEMKTDENKEDGVWVVKKRTILNVIKVSAPAVQQSFKLPLTSDDE